MKNSDYWRRRAEILEESRNFNAGTFTAEVEKEFNIAQKTLDEQIEQWYGRFARNNEISLTEARGWLSGKDLAEFKWDVNEYIEHGKDVINNPAYIKQLENASARFHISKLESLKTKTQNTIEQLYGHMTKKSGGVFGKIYQDMYYHTAYELQRGIGIGWDIAALNPHQIESVLSKPWTLDKITFSDRLWTQKQSLLDEVHTRLTQNLLLGKTPDEAISAISKKFKTSKSNAGRLVMTESAYFASEAQKSAYKTIDVEEFEIVGTLDGKTCHVCGGYDGKHLPMPQFDAGVTAPPFHPWCRCVTAPYFPDDDDVRFARGEDGKAFYVPSDIKYDEWRDKFVDSTGKKTYNNPVEIKTLKVEVSGAIPRGNWTRMDKHGARYYEEIRQRTTDVAAISKNLGMTEEEIAIVKQHVFFNEYSLGEDVPRRFDPSYDMAVSWQRLIDGKDIREMDRAMIGHELIEHEHMMNGMDYEQAHILANKSFNYEAYTLELDRKAGLK